MKAIAQQINDLSLKRLLLDSDSGFPGLRKIPSIGIKIFLEYIDSLSTEELRPLILDLYKNQYPCLGMFEASSVPLSSLPLSVARFEKAYEELFRLWKFKSPGLRNSLIETARRRGRLPPQGIVPGDDVSIETIQELSLVTVPTENEIVDALKQHFQVKRVKSRGANSYRYHISQMGDDYGTYLFVLSKGFIVHYHHQIGSVEDPNCVLFQLFEHCLQSRGANWDMLTSDSLERSVLVLKSIVEVFENTVKACVN
jgi:hypothetical protein